MADEPTRGAPRDPSPAAPRATPPADDTLVVSLDELRASTRALLWLVDDLDDPEPIETFSLDEPPAAPESGRRSVPPPMGAGGDR